MSRLDCRLGGGSKGPKRSILVQGTDPKEQDDDSQDDSDWSDERSAHNTLITRRDANGDNESNPEDDNPNEDNDDNEKNSSSAKEEKDILHENGAWYNLQYNLSSKIWPVSVGQLSKRGKGNVRMGGKATSLQDYSNGTGQRPKKSKRSGERVGS